MDNELTQKVAETLQRKRKLEAQLRDVKDELAELEPLMLSEMRDNQMQRLTIKSNGKNVTLFSHSLLVAKPKTSREEVIETLDQLGLGMVSKNYNTQTLNAYVREQLAEGNELPQSLAAVLDTELLVSLRGRQSVDSESTSAKATRNIN